MLHWTYNKIQDRFQEFAPDYAEGKMQTDLVPVESINKVPIAMFTGTLDEVCPHKQAVEYSQKMGDIVVDFESYKDKTHGFWSYASDDHFIEQLVAQLQVPSELEETFL